MYVRRCYLHRSQDNQMIVESWYQRCTLGRMI